MEQEEISVSNNLEVLAEGKNHATLMLAEVAGWMHDMGKCDERHLEQEASDYTGPKDPYPYDYKKDHAGRVGTANLELSGESVTLKELIEEGIPSLVDEMSKPWLVRALGFCHGAAHTEKELVFHLVPQTITDTRLSSSFGYESKPLKELNSKLDDLLKELNTELGNLSLGRLLDRATLLRSVKAAFSDVCADTERPINDVSLWDWSNIVAAMYKAVLAAALLGNKEEPSGNMHWRLLSVRLNGAAFSERAIRIPDLLARQKLITDGLDKVRTLLEKKYPLGTEVYRDENGSVFIVPNIIGSLLDLEDGQHKELRSLIIEEFSSGMIKNDPSLALNGEVIPSLEYDEVAWTREMPKVGGKSKYEHQKPLPIAEHIKAEKGPSLRADVHAVKSWWESENQPLCSVCQLRPQGWDASGKVDEKARERKVCSICERRREDRSKKWATEDKLGNTIWIDEIADASGMLALVVGKFDLTHWLDGTMVFYPDREAHARSRVALRLRCLNSKVVKEDRVRIHQNNMYTWAYFPNSLKSLDVVEKDQYPGPFKDDRLQMTSPQIAVVEVTDVQRLPEEEGYILTVESLPSGLVANNDLVINGQNFRVAEDGVRIETASEGAVRLVENKTLQLKGFIVEEAFKLWEMEEAHTPARLQRVWETTQKFWKDCEGRLADEDVVGKVRLRLRIKGSVEGGNKNNLGSYHTYEIKLGNIRVSVVYVEQDDDFVIIDNLRYVASLLDAPEEYQKDERAAAAFIKGWLQREKSLPLETPAGYGNVNKLAGILQIGPVIEEEIAYVPALTILKEPGTFMTLVPADKALKVADEIKKRYEEEMGKVRNRLPLTVGVVFAGSRTPLPAILDAGRRVLRQPAEDEEWEVKEIAPLPVSQSWPSEVQLTLEREQRSISMKVPTVMRDGKTRDEWYPYWRMAFPVANEWVHVSDLRPRDRVYLTPSRFDFEFLDTSARRFEMSYGGGGRRGENHPSRPYYLEELNSFQELWTLLSRGLKASQIHNLVGLIETKRQEWQPEKDNATFERIVGDILNNAEWKQRPEDAEFKQLVKAGVSGQLADVVEFYSFLDEQLGKLVAEQRRGNV